MKESGISTAMATDAALAPCVAALYDGHSYAHMGPCIHAAHELYLYLRFDQCPWMRASLVASMDDVSTSLHNFAGWKPQSNQ